MELKDTEAEEIDDDENIFSKIINSNMLMTDLTLAVGESKYDAHRIMLSQSSEVFKCMLDNPNFVESKQSEITLFEEPKTAKVFPLFLRYIYNKQVRIDIENAMPLLSLADKYAVKKLSNLAKEFMLENIALAASKGYFISWLQHNTLIPDHQQLTNELKTFLILNIKMVVNGGNIAEFDPNDICTILKQNDLVVESEFEVFDIAENYVTLKRVEMEMNDLLSADEIENQTKQLIEGIFSYVRFPMMTIDEIVTIPLEIIAGYHRFFFHDRVTVAMEYHADRPIQPEDEYFQYTPRIYTSFANFCVHAQLSNIQEWDNYKCMSTHLYSLECLPYKKFDNNTIYWKIEFFPKGIRFHPAILHKHPYLPVNESQIPETALDTVRVRITGRIFDETRYKIAVLVWKYENNIEYIKKIRTHIDWFSKDKCVFNFDNLIPFEETQKDESTYFLGKNRDSMEFSIVITPFSFDETRESPPFEF